MAESPESLQSDQAVFAIEEFLSSEETKDLLRFSTAGSVDDGKSTLIGRMLHDARGAYEDQLKSEKKNQARSFSTRQSAP